MRFARSILHSSIAAFFCAALLSASPGSSTAYLRCVSESGRTKLSADLQDITMGLKNISVSIDSVSYTLKDDNTTTNVIWDPKHEVFTVVVRSAPSVAWEDQRSIEFWAIPGTWQVEDHGTRWTFEGRMRATDPRPDPTNAIGVIELQCSLEYSI